VWSNTAERAGQVEERSEGCPRTSTEALRNALFYGNSLIVDAEFTRRIRVAITAVLSIEQV
jgi:hypothetical protein